MVKSMALSAQVPCYVRPSYNHSICDLPAVDYARVFWTVKSSVVSQISDIADKFAADEALSCMYNATSQCPLVSRPKHVVSRDAFRSTAYLKHLRLTARLLDQFDRRTACPFARSSTVTDEELTYAVVDSLSRMLGWSENTAVDWHALTHSYSVSQSTIRIEVGTTANHFYVFIIGLPIHSVDCRGQTSNGRWRLSSSSVTLAYEK